MTTSHPLSLAEELVLITLDDETGKLISSAKPYALDIGIAASLIMELTLKGRIDTDPDRLFVVSTAPTNHPMLDALLDEIAAEKNTLSTAAWLTRLAKQGERLIDEVVQGLVERGILKTVEKRLLWVFKTRVYPPSSGIEEREVRARVMQLLNSDDIPEPRDALIVGLLRATDLMNYLLSASEQERLQARIDHIANLEEINRALSKAVHDAWEAIINSVPVIRIC